MPFYGFCKTCKRYFKGFSQTNFVPKHGGPRKYKSSFSNPGPCHTLRFFSLLSQAIDCRASALAQAAEARTLAEKITGVSYAAPLTEELQKVSVSLTQDYHKLTALITAGNKEEEAYVDLFESVNSNITWLKTQKPVCGSLKKAADAEVEAMLSEEEQDHEESETVE